MTPHKGSCLCGAVQYELASRPARSTICYCRFCQVATGSERMVLAVLPEADFRLTSGTAQVYTHISEGSGKALHINFCPSCGTKLFVEFERWPGNTGIYSGTLDDPGILPMDADHAKQIFAGQARPGTVLRAGLPTFEEHATTLDGTPLQAVVLDSPQRVEDVVFPPQGGK